MTDIPSGWEQKKFGDIFKVKYGKAIDKSLREDSARYPVVGSAGVMTYTKIPLTSEPTIVIGRKGNVGSIQVFKDGCYPIDTTYYMHSCNEFDLDFLTHLLTSLELVKLDSSTATPSLRREDLEDVRLVIPPLPEQDKIVEILEDHLSRLDAALADVKQAKVKAAQFRRSLLQAAFTGNLGSDGTRLMTELPQGWTRTTIGEVCEKPKYGWTTSASESGQIRLLRTTDLTRGPLTWESVPFCKESPKNFADFEVHKNDIFISRAGSVGVSVLVKEVPFASVFASYLIRLRPTNKVNAKFLALFLQSPNYWDQVLELSSGIALANINATKIQSMSLPLPPLPEQHKIVEILEDHLSRLDAYIDLADAIERQSAGLRRSLLQAAFTGQLTKEVASV